MTNTELLEKHNETILQLFNEHRKNQGFDHVGYISSADLKHLLECAKTVVEAEVKAPEPLTYENCPCPGCVIYREERIAIEKQCVACGDLFVHISTDGEKRCEACNTAYNHEVAGCAHRFYGTRKDGTKVCAYCGKEF